ncbi:YncE family protein [bacterium]|nr:YncE family protein [bacterium]
MIIRKLLFIAIGLVGLAVILYAVYTYRYLVLSKLNIQTTTQETTLGLRQDAEVPMSGSASRFDYQNVDSQDGLLFIAHMDADQVIVFDLKQEKIAATISNLSNVHSVLAIPETGRLYATATGAHQVEVLDLHTYQVLARVVGGSYPDGMAYDPNDKKLFVSDESGGGVIVINTQTSQQIDKIDLGGQVGNTLYDAQGHQIVSAAQGRNQLALIDPLGDRVSASIDLPGCAGPHGFYLDDPTRMAYVSCEENAALLAVNIETKQIIARDTVGEVPDVLAFDPGLKRLYVAAESGVVTVFQVEDSTLKKLGQTYLAPNAHTIAVDPQAQRVYLPLENINGKPVLRIFSEELFNR